MMSWLESVINPLEIIAEKAVHGGEQPREVLVRNRDPKVNVFGGAMVAVMIHGVTAHEQILNPGAVQALQKLAEFGR